MNKLKEKLTEELATNVILEIVNKLYQLDDNNVEFDFEVKQGNMQSSTNDMQGNTTMFFDITEDTPSLYQLKKIVDNEEFDSEEYSNIIAAFIQSIVNNLVDNHMTDIRTNVRRLVMKDSDDELFPLKYIKIKYIDIIDASDLPLSVTNMIGVNKLPLDPSDEGTSSGQVGPELINLVEKTGKDVNQIIKEKKEEGDLKYKYVLDAQWIKYLYEFYLIMDVDYAPIPKEEYEAILEERSKNET